MLRSLTILTLNTPSFSSFLLFRLLWNSYTAGLFRDLAMTEAVSAAALATFTFEISLQLWPWNCFMGDSFSLLLLHDMISLESELFLDEFPSLLLSRFLLLLNNSFSATSWAAAPSRDDSSMMMDVSVDDVVGGDTVAAAAAAFVSIEGSVRVRFCNGNDFSSSLVLN